MTIVYDTPDGMRPSSYPNGISVIVVADEGASREEIAMSAGQVAADLYPDRSFGPVLYVEECADGFEVVISDLGPSSALHS